MRRGEARAPLRWMLLAAAFTAGCGTAGTAAPDERGPLARAKTFLAAGDYRRAIDMCQLEATARPSASSYVYVTYVYQALDAYLDALAKADQWVAVEQVARSLSGGRPEELLEAPDVLARIAKELIQDAARRQADVAAAQATRLDRDTAARLWSEQKRWRAEQPEGWWFGVPREWGW